MADDIGSEDYSVALDDAISTARREPGETATPRADKSFLTHAMIYGLGAVALQAASVILVPLYTRYLTPAEFGVLEMLNRIGEVFYLCLIANGLRLAAFTFYCQAKTDLERKRTASTMLFVPLLVLFVAGLLAAVATPFLNLLAGVNDPTLVVFAVVVALLEGLTVVPLALIQARVDSAYYVVVMAAMFCFRVTLAFVAVACLGWGVWGILGSTAATFVVFGAVLSWRELRKASFHLDWKILREVFRFALPFVPAGLCGMLLHNGDRFFLMKYAGADELGLYALGYKVALVVGMLSTGPLSQVWTARMYDAFDLPDAARNVGRVCTRILAAYVFVALGVCLFQQEVIHLLAASCYQGATAVIAPITLAYFFWTLSNLMDAPLWVRRRSSLKAWIVFVSAAVTLGLYAWLIPLHGARGAVAATLLSLTVHCGITYVVSQRIFHVDYEFGRILLMLVAAIGLLLAGRGAAPGLLGLVEKALLWAAWPVGLWWGGLVSRQEKAMVLDIWQRARQWLAHAVPGWSVD
jgi:O-antigen/teichoic acid export membrane protein